jgi:hypothetical protein
MPTDIIIRAIMPDPEHDQYLCSAAGAAYLLDMPIRSVWKDMVETGRLRVVYLPSGYAEIAVPKKLVVNQPDPRFGA